MIVRNVTRDQLERAAQEVRVSMEGPYPEGRGFRLRLVPETSRPYKGLCTARERYLRRSASHFHPNRRVFAVCWHGHRDFMRAVFVQAPNAQFRTALATYDGVEDFERTFKATGDRNIGSMVYPVRMREACRCVEQGLENDTHRICFASLEQRDGRLVETNFRMIRQADILKCPHVILVPSHYRNDGTCRCNDAEHAEMQEWGYTWNGERWQ